MIIQHELRFDATPNLTELLDAHPARTLLAEAAVVFIEHRASITVCSCATGARWSQTTITQCGIRARPRPYRLHAGERYARRNTLTEATKQQALAALNRDRLLIE